MGEEENFWTISERAPTPHHTKPHFPAKSPLEFRIFILALSKAMNTFSKYHHLAEDWEWMMSLPQKRDTTFDMFRAFDDGNKAVKRFKIKPIR